MSCGRPVKLRPLGFSGAAGMLHQLHSLAIRLRWTYPLLMIIGAMALAMTAWIAIGSDNSAEESWLIPAILLLGWCFLLLCFLNLFRVVPAIPVPGMGWRQRLLLRAQRGFLWAVALGFVMLTLALVVVTIKLLSTWMSA
jgi:hypothetical protein